MTPKSVHYCRLACRNDNDWTKKFSGGRQWQKTEETALDLKAAKTPFLSQLIPSVRPSGSTIGSDFQPLDQALASNMNHTWLSIKTSQDHLLVTFPSSHLWTYSGQCSPSYTSKPSRHANISSVAVMWGGGAPCDHGNRLNEHCCLRKIFCCPLFVTLHWSTSCGKNWLFGNNGKFVWLSFFCGT